MKIVEYLYITILILLLVSCSTMGDQAVSKAAVNATGMLERAEVDALTGSSGTPFLFETEVLPAPSQLAALWQGLADSGYSFGPQGELEVYSPDDDTWRRFSSSRDVQVWFERHAPEKAALVVIPNAEGRLILIIDRDRRRSTRLRGLKVEQD